MKKLAFLCSLFLCLGAGLSAKDQELKYNKDGKFKIVQFTDIHYKVGNETSAQSLELIDMILKREKPDLVVVTGDIVYARPALEGMRIVTEQIAKHKVPFVITFGNHDREFEATNTELYDLVRTIPYNYLPERPADVASPDYVLEVKASKSDEVANILYFLDSQSYDRKIKQYEWIKPEQIDWYRKTSAEYTVKNGGTPYNALAFFHIPLPEFREATRDENVALVGIRKEAVCPPEHNSGMFQAVLDCKDVMGIFNGHEHDNDFSVYYKGVLMAYGRFGGGTKTVYNNLPAGARIIEMHEGERKFTSWVVDKYGVKQNETVYPDTYIKK
jgi:hypothetical protein